ncbi:MAG: (2Fe-2S) ferredoxin domain-containing protein [Spirochaetia bacterium]
MAKMTLADLKKLREEKKKEMNKRETEGKDIQIIVGGGTCGIAAGSKETLNSILEELDTENIENATVKQSGCMGLCYVEPTVEVKVPGMPDTIYGNVDKNVAREIVHKHIMNKELVNNHIFDKPAQDIVKE